MPNPAVIRAAMAVLSDERTRKGTGWGIAAVLSPVILLVAILCSLASGTADHNAAAVELCFHGGALPTDTPSEYAAYIEDMRTSFELLDTAITEINGMTEGETSLDGTRVKAVFYALYFGTDSPSLSSHRAFTDCFVTYEERTRTVTVTNEEGTEVEQEETYTIAIPICREGGGTSWKIQNTN